MTAGFVLLLVALAWAIASRLLTEDASASAPAGRPPAPVAVAPIERGAITLRRTFSGALEASAEFVVAPKIPGRVDGVLVDLGDRVERGQLVARLEDAELRQAVILSEADLAVARVRATAAKAELDIAARNLQRLEGLRQEGVASESQLDSARMEELASRTSLDLAQVGIARAESGLEAARIRLGYASVTADWDEGDDLRVVASRLVDEGETVSANTALLSVVELDPLLAVVHAPERDYARLAVGQVALLEADAYPGRTFEGTLIRIAPIFRRATRQARVELAVPNADELLKPGMFVRVTIELEQLTDAQLVPYDALSERGDETGVFVLDPDGSRVHWRPVRTGIREGLRIQVEGEGLSGEVVVLGQELCEDGSPVTTVREGAPPR